MGAPQKAHTSRNEHSQCWQTRREARRPAQRFSSTSLIAPGQLLSVVLSTLFVWYTITIPVSYLGQMPIWSFIPHPSQYICRWKNVLWIVPTDHPSFGVYGADGCVVWCHLAGDYRTGNMASWIKWRRVAGGLRLVNKFLFLRYALANLSFKAFVEIQPAFLFLLMLLHVMISNCLGVYELFERSGPVHNEVLTPHVYSNSLYYLSGILHRTGALFRMQ